MVRCTIKERDIPFTFFHNGLFGYSFVVSKGEVLLFSSNKEKWILDTIFSYLKLQSFRLESTYVSSQGKRRGV